MKRLRAVRWLEKREEGKEKEDKVGDFRGEIFLRLAFLTSAYVYYCLQVREIFDRDGGGTG